MRKLNTLRLSDPFWLFFGVTRKKTFKIYGYSALKSKNDASSTPELFDSYSVHMDVVLLILHKMEEFSQFRVDKAVL